MERAVQPATFEFVAVGEILVDLVATDRMTPLGRSRGFTKLFGGAPANVAANMQRLGVPATIVSKVGQDGLGDFLVESLAGLGVDGRYVTRHASLPTSLVVVTSGQTPPEFIAYRQADTALAPEDIPEALLAGCKIFHTTAHGIARKPTQQTVLDAFRRAHARGVWTSFDPNYAPSFWPDRVEALSVIREFLACTTFCKPSLDDAQRLFDSTDEQFILNTLHELGAEVVLLTLGKEGALFSRRGGQALRFAAETVADVLDPTGAGDAFTAGFLATYLRTRDEARAMRAGVRAATLKLGHLGAIAPLPSLDSLLASIDSAER